jgi:hypothetical protein
MQTTMTVDRSGTPGRARLLARLAVALAAGLALGFGLGHVTAPGSQAQQPVIKFVPVTVNNDQPGKAPSHRELW